MVEQRHGWDARGFPVPPKLPNALQAEERFRVRKDAIEVLSEERHGPVNLADFRPRVVSERREQAQWRRGREREREREERQREREEREWGGWGGRRKRGQEHQCQPTNTRKIKRRIKFL